MLEFFSERLKKMWSGKINETKSDLKPDGGVEFKINATYFALDLQGMNLKEDYRALTEFVPFVAFLVRYGEGEDPMKSSVLFSPAEILATIGGGESSIRPDIRSVSLIPPRPFVADRIEIFGGLFREKRADSGEVLFDTLGELSKAGMVIPGAAHLKVAEIAYQGIQKLLGVESLSGRATVLRGFSSAVAEDHPDRLKPGNFIMLGAGDLGAKDIEIVNGEPKVNTVGQESAFARMDWVVLRIRCETRRGTYSDLGFDEKWNAFKTHLWSGRTAEAAQNYLSLNAAIATSDLLIDEEKDVLLQEYNLRKLKEEKRLAMAGGGSAVPVGDTRSASGLSTMAEKSFRALVDQEAIALSRISGDGPVAAVANALGSLANSDGSDWWEDEADQAITAERLDDLRKRLGPAIDPVTTAAALSTLWASDLNSLR